MDVAEARVLSRSTAESPSRGSSEVSGDLSETNVH